MLGASRHRPMDNPSLTHPRDRPYGWTVQSIEPAAAPNSPGEPLVEVVDLRVRYTPYWRLATGRGCVAPGPEGWTRVR